MTTVIRQFALCLGLLGLSLPAQNLEMKVEGGSFPGQIDWSLDGGQAFKQFGLLIVSGNSGPTVLPWGQHSLRVGLELLSASPAGAFVASELSFPSLVLPNQPSVLGVTLYLQGLSLPGSSNFIDSISAPVALQIQNANTMQPRASMMSPRGFFDMLPMSDGRRVAAGGGTGAILALIGIKATEIYDPITDSYTPGPDMSVERAMYAKTKLKDGTWLLSGGVNGISDPQKLCEIFDGQSAAPVFTATGQMATQRFAHTASRLPDGRVLVTGGIDWVSGSSFTMLKTTEIYDPVTKLWTPGPKLSARRSAHLALTLPDNRVLLIGGVSPWLSFPLVVPQVLSSTDIYDPVTNTISAGPSMSGARAAFALSEIGPGRWLVAGGVSSALATTAGAEIFDAATMQWSSAGSLSKARALLFGFELNGKVAVMGGASGSLVTPVPEGVVDVYDVATGKWSLAPAFASPRAAFGGYKTASGQVHVLGGDAGGLTGVQSSTVRYYR